MEATNSDGQSNTGLITPILAKSVHYRMLISVREEEGGLPCSDDPRQAI